MNIGIVVATRLNSSRLPNKAALKINGKSIIHHLHERLSEFGIQIIYAIPLDEEDEYNKIFSEIDDNILVYYGSHDDPLKRMANAATHYNLDAVVRVTHDKIFLNSRDFYQLSDMFNSMSLDYIYSSSFTPGTGMEIISNRVLQKAAQKYKDVEHISYSIKSLTNNSYDMPLDGHNPNYRLLIDYPEDLELITIILSVLGNDCTREQVFHFLSNNEWLQKINRKPKITVYTCCYNNQEFIEECMESVVKQTGFHEMEYLLIDDCSYDLSTYMMAKFSTKYPNVKYIRNNHNLGLASSSNVALSKARGDYIMRLDADDYLPNPYCIEKLYKRAIDEKFDIVYGNNFYGSYDKIQKGNEKHHAGCAFMNTKALNHVKFTDKLRNHDSLDLFVRAKEQLKIGYLDQPVFFYRQHKESMSKNNIEERSKIEQQILNGELIVQ